MYGKFKKMELSKEHLLAFWDMVLNRSDFKVHTGEKVENIKKEANGIFTVTTATENQYRTRAVILASGPNRYSAQARRTRRRIAQSDVPPA